MTITHGFTGKQWARVRDQAGKWLFLVPAIVFILIFFGYPIVQNFIMSFEAYTTKTFFTGEAPFVGFDNYITAITRPIFGRAVLNTALFTLGCIALQFSIGLLLAVFFHRKFPLNTILRSLMLLPWLLPLLVSSTVWRGILDADNGILNEAIKALGLSEHGVPWLTSPAVALVSVILVNVWIGIPFNVVILYSGLQDIPEELYEAAALDGATGARAFWSITFPLLRPVINVALLLGVVYTIKVVDIIIALTGGGPANATQTISIQSYESSFVNFNFGLGAAWGNILIVISLILSAIYLRANRKALEVLTSQAFSVTKPAAYKSRRSLRATGKSIVRLSNTAIGVLIVALMLFPIYWMINGSFAPTGTTLNRNLIPIDPTFDGYVAAIQQQGRALVISAIIAVSAVVLCLAISAPAAFAVAHFRLKGIRVFLGVILVTQMIPGIVVANALYSLYNTLGLLNSLPGLILANATSGIPFAVLVMSAYMQALPKELVEAARVDGAGYWRAFWSIVLPVSKNALVTAAIFTFLHGWGDFLFALTLTTTDDVRPVTLGLYNYIGSDYIQWNAVFATATLASIPALAFLIFAQKYIAAGTSSGALK